MRAPFLVSALLLLTAAAGCIDRPGADVDPASGPGGADGTLAPLTETVEGSIQASVATPLRTINYGGAYMSPLALTETLTGVVIEMEWSAASPASEKLSVWVRIAGAGSLPPSDPMELVSTPPPIALVESASPLRLVLSMDGVEPGDYEILVRAAGPAGVAAEQPFTLHVTSFDGIAFNEAFTALPAE